MLLGKQRVVFRTQVGGKFSHSLLLVELAVTKLFFAGCEPH